MFFICADSYIYNSCMHYGRKNREKKQKSKETLWRRATKLLHGFVVVVIDLTSQRRCWWWWQLVDRCKNAFEKLYKMLFPPTLRIDRLRISHHTVDRSKQSILSTGRTNTRQEFIDLNGMKLSSSRILIIMSKWFMLY